MAILAGELATIHGWDARAARRAGLAHDCVKEWSPARLLAYVKRHGLRVPSIDFILRNAPNVLHAYVGAHYARRKGWVASVEEARAIETHTLGATRMTAAQKILYVADFSSPGRTYPEARIIRALARRDLERAFRESVSTKMSFQLRRGKPIHPIVIRIWNRLHEPAAPE